MLGFKKTLTMGKMVYWFSVEECMSLSLLSLSLHSLWRIRDTVERERERGRDVNWREHCASDNAFVCNFGNQKL